MKIDKRTLDRLLKMDDESLEALIRQIAAETGMDPSAVGIRSTDIGAIRQALSNATQADIDNLNFLYDAYRQSHRKG